MTPPKQHRDVTKTSSRHPRDISKALRKQTRDTTVTPRDITQATQNQDRHITETRPRHDREHEFFNLEAFSVDIRVTATLVCPKVHNIQIQNGILDFASNPDQNVHQCSSPNNQNTITKEKKQHCNLNETTPSHHPLIIINITAPSPHITEISPKHARDVTNTSLKHPQNTTKKPTKPHQNNTETSAKKGRDKTETSLRHHRNVIETSLRHHRNVIETGRDITAKHYENKTETSP